MAQPVVPWSCSPGPPPLRLALHHHCDFRSAASRKVFATSRHPPPRPPPPPILLRYRWGHITLWYSPPQCQHPSPETEPDALLFDPAAVQDACRARRLLLDCGRRSRCISPMSTAPTASTCPWCSPLNLRLFIFCKSLPGSLPTPSHFAWALTASLKRIVVAQSAWMSRTSPLA